GWLRRIEPVRVPRPRITPAALQREDDPIAARARIPSSAWRTAAEALQHGPVLIQVARPGAEIPLGSERTAADLGRAFPQVPVQVADSAHPLERVPATPAIIVATRGAEPIAEDGYAAVLLLDGDRM